MTNFPPPDVDTGVAKWVYQMMSYYEWDYDGVNEMILRCSDGQTSSWTVRLDWGDLSGHRRYHAECHVGHVPDGEGSSDCPRAGVDLLKTMKRTTNSWLITVQGRRAMSPGGSSA